jgi:hypothetical protein
MTPELHTAIRQALIRSQALGSNQDIRALFADPRLQPWRNNVPEGSNPAARAAMLIAYLHDRANTQGQKALALLLQVLGEFTDEGDALHAELLTLAAQLDPTLQPPPATPPPGESTPRPSDQSTTPPPDQPAPSPTPYTTFDLHIAPGGHVVATSSRAGPPPTSARTSPRPSPPPSTRSRTRATSAATLKELGENLYRWLFPPPIQRHLGRAEAVARERGTSCASACASSPRPSPPSPWSSSTGRSAATTSPSTPAPPSPATSTSTIPNHRPPPRRPAAHARHRQPTPRT